MARNNYINTDPGAYSTGPFFDRLGEFEMSGETIYTLLVYKPTRPLFGCPVLSVQDKSKYDSFKKQDLEAMKTTMIEIKAKWFPSEFFCEHLSKTERKCESGCYSLEEGGKLKNWTCGNTDCQGHVYCGDVKGVACFGKKGKRMVCVNKVDE